MGEPQWVRRFTQVGRTGAYLSVVQDGVVHQGDPIAVVSRPGHGITVPMAFRAFTGDLELARRVLAANCLVDVEAAELRETVERRGG
jgi:MOSC domain-containing protein YiiM